MAERYWVSGADGREYGPVDLDALAQWVRERRVLSSTLVRREDDRAREAGRYPELAALFSPGEAGTVSTAAVPPAEFAVWSFVGQAWHLVKPYWLELGLMFFIQAAIGSVPYVGGVVQFVIGGAILIGIWRAIHGLIDGRPPQVGMMFGGFDRLGEAFLATLVGGVAIALGLVAFVVPGVILSLMWLFSLNILAERNIGFWEAFRRSAELTRGYRWQLLLLCLANALVILLGLCALCVGVFVAEAVAFTALALAYRFLENEKAPAGGPNP